MQLDLVAYSGYKYVGLVINSVVGLLGGSVAYYIVSLSASMCSRSALPNTQYFA